MEQHFPFLFWAYNIIWILMAGYILNLGVRMRRIQRRLDQLKGNETPGDTGRGR